MRQSEGKIRMKESQIFNIKIPPTPYQYQKGEGFESAAEKFKQSLMNLGRGDLGALMSENDTSEKESEIIKIATKFLSNGRPLKVEKKEINNYDSSTLLTTSATTTPHPVINSPSETETATLPFQPETTTETLSTSTQTSSIKTTTSSTSNKSTTIPLQLLTRFPQSTNLIPQQLMKPLTLYQHPTFMIPYHLPTYPPTVPFTRHKKVILPASTTLLRSSPIRNGFLHFNPFPIFRYPRPFYGR